MNMIVSKKECTACTACFNICSKQAISIIEDNEGFKYPLIDEKKCINCGLCQKVCPVLNKHKNDALNDCLVAYNNHQGDIVNSSSGGIFPLIAHEFLKYNGIVIGAAFNEKMELKHIAIEEEKDLDKLKGSKYLQSDLGDIFKTVKDNMEYRKVLFVGTPCQVAGLKSYLKQEHHNLFCIDLICHGVPSPKIFQKYIIELEEKFNDKIKSYQFRDKSTGWDTYSNTAKFKNNTFSQYQKDNDYMKLFLSDVALRESCYNCKFKLGNKYSDITLGDFWGVAKFYPEMYNKKGVSAIIVNTNKGESILEKVKNDMSFKKCTLDEIVAGNPSLISSPHITSKRQHFFEDIEKYKVEELLKKCTKNKSLLKRVYKKLVFLRKK